MYGISRSQIGLTNLQKNLIVSAVSSLLFFTGWWVIADADVHEEMEKRQTYYAPGIVGTAAFFFTNVVPAHYFYDSFTYQQGCFTPGFARSYLFVWLMISFGCLIAAFYILVNDFILKPEVYQWPGYGIWLQNVLIFISSMVLRFAKKHDPFY